MSSFVYVVAYAAIFVFLLAVVARVRRYRRVPLHLRWELYPVAHEGQRAAYGGSYLEDVDWDRKKPEHSVAGTLKVMVPEIVFLKAVHESNRPLWYVSYPFHLGLYLSACFAFTVVVAAVATLAGMPLAPEGGLGLVVNVALHVFGLGGFVLTILGAFGLIARRLTDPGLRPYSSLSHFFNLLLFIAAMGLAVAGWVKSGYSFAGLTAFFVDLLAFRMTPIGDGLLAAEIVAAFVLLAYIPMTHMAHFFMKWFLYHDIRWGDASAAADATIGERLKGVLAYKVSWAAPHIGSGGKKSWAEVATENTTGAKE